MKGKKKNKNKNIAVQSEPTVAETEQQATAEPVETADDIVAQSQDTAAPQDSTSVDEATAVEQRDNADNDAQDNADAGDAADTDTVADNADTEEQSQDSQNTDDTDSASDDAADDTQDAADASDAGSAVQDDAASDADSTDTAETPIDTDTVDNADQTDSVDTIDNADEAEQTADADNAEPDAPTDAEGQPAKKKKRTHLPFFGTVFDKDGQKIGKVRRDVCYDSNKQKVGKLVNEDDALYLVQDGRHKGYLDNNHNLFGTDNEYVATIRYKHSWLIAVLILLVLALIMISAVIAALYTAPSTDIIPTLFIADKQGNNWNETKDLPIFFNEKFGDTVIEPGQEGSYAFVFENRNEVALLYALEFSCENEYGINLVYRLKRDGAYVAGNDGWVALDRLHTDELQIQARSSALFELEWKWEHNDPVDTAAGENGAMYKLFIVLRAKAI